MHLRAALVLATVTIAVTGCGTRSGLTEEQRNAAITRALTVPEKTFEAIGASAPPLPPAAKTMLQPTPFTTGVQAPVSEPRFDINADQVKVANFYHGLVEGTPYNVVVHPDVNGTVSLRLSDVSVPEVMEIMREGYGYHYQRTEGSFLVTPSVLETRMFSLNYINVQREGTSGTSISSGEIQSSDDQDNNNGNNGDNSDDGNNRNSGNSGVSGSNLTTRSSSRLWEDVESAIEQIIAGRGTSQSRANDQSDESPEGQESSPNALASGLSALQGGNQDDQPEEGADNQQNQADTADTARVVTSPEAGSIIVRATPETLDQVETFIEGLQTTINRQVILEARIIEVSLDDRFEAGIDWNYEGSDDGEDLSLNLTPRGVDTGGMFEFGIIRDNTFSATINALDKQGDVMVLSSPRVSTLNNQKALIKVGTDTFFQTGVELDTTITDGTAQTTVNPEFNSFFSGISLDVTPSIDANGYVTLHVQPSVSNVSEVPRTVQTSSDSDDQVQFQLASSDVRRSDSIVRAQSGDLIVIGGLMEQREQTVDSSVPGLGQVPPLNLLFGRERQVSEKVELVILLRPTVVGKDTWKKAIDRQLEALL